MSYYNTNLAYDDEELEYDLSRFDTSLRDKRRKEEEQAKASAIKEAPAMSASKTGSVIKIALSVAVLFGALFSVNYFNTQKYNASRMVAEQEKLLAEAQDDNALLRSKLDAKANISYIEEYASEKLGMTKITSAQKEYISINENLIEVEQDETEGFIGSVRKWFSHTLEYMGF